MPPKLQRLPRKLTSDLVKPTDGGDDELAIGNIRVGPHGVYFIGENEQHVVPRADLKFAQLRRVHALGSGSQGNVAMYVTDEQATFAVKTIQISSMACVRVRQTVAAELRNIFASRDNEYTVQLHNAFFRDGSLKLVMEYMDWGSLRELIKSKVKLPETVCAFIASQMLRALNILHRKSNIVTESSESKSMRQIHRDIKPCNVLLATDGRVKLADFGIATSTETIGVNSFVGTVTYMSPERIRGERYCTPSDIWSVGVVVAEMLLGYYPFQSAKRDFMALLREITTIESYPFRELVSRSSDARQFISQCLRQRTEDRSTATELLETQWIVDNECAGREELIELLESIGNTRNVL